MPPKTLDAAKAETLAFGLSDPHFLARPSDDISGDDALARLEKRLQRYGCGVVAADVHKLLWEGRDARGGRDLVAMLRHHARAHLRHGGPWARLVADPDTPGREILRWRWLSLALPPLLWTCLMHEGREGRPPPVVRVLPPNLTPIEPVAILHLHEGAAGEFEALWLGLMEAAGQGYSPGRSLAALQERDGPEGIDLEAWRRCLHAAALARRALATAGAIADADRPWLDALATGALTQGGTPRLAATRVPGDGGPGEMEVVRGALVPPQHLEQLGVQYLRVKVLTYRRIVADPTVLGLHAFTKAYDRMGRYVKAAGADGATFNVDSGDIRIDVVERRITPTKWVKQSTKREERGPSNHYDVIHFLRGDLGRQSARDRFKARAAEVEQIKRQLLDRPSALRHLRGLDVAGAERAEPLWLFLPAFRATRAASQRASALDPRVEPLRVTVHAGEDFVHLASGLRAVHEPFVWGLIEPGDRIGHALALGLDPERWFRDHPVVVMPAWERLLDLGWVRAAAVQLGVELSFTEAERFTNEAQRCLRRLGARDIDPSLLWERLGEPALLADYPQQVGRAGDDVDRLIQRWLQDRNLAEVRLEVTTSADASALARLHRALLAHIRAWQVPIEVNPTSNLLIAGLDAPMDQPMFSMAPLNGEDGLPIVISTDDPLMFTTTVADEFAYAWAGVSVAQGAPPSRTREWLEEAARTSRRTSFAAQRTY